MSPQMLINRLGELTSSFQGIGGFAYAEMGNSGYQIKAVRMHKAIRDLFPNVTSGSPVSDLTSDRLFFLNGGIASECTITVPCRTELSKLNYTFKFSCEMNEHQDNKRGVFITLERLEKIR